MYLDFHTHGKLAKKLPFSPEYTHWLFSEAKNAGLDALCLTEHFNTLGFAQVYGYIADHILSIGPLDAILELNRRLEPNKEKSHFLPFAQLMDLFAEYPVLVGAGHPYRAGGHIPELPARQLERLHFLDMNGKDIAEDRLRTEQLTRALGQQLHKPVVSGSDTHQAVQYGCIRTRFDRTVNRIPELYVEMQAGRYEICVSPEAAFQVKTAALLKRALKEIHALGGDYVSVLLGGTPKWSELHRDEAAE